SNGNLQPGTSVQGVVNNLPSSKTAFGGFDLPAGEWRFLSLTYDGQSLSCYGGSETAPAALISSVSFPAGELNVGNSWSLFLGNRADQKRAFQGAMDDVRFYLGAAPVDAIDTIRRAAAPASQVINGVTANGDGSITLSFTGSPSATYQVQFTTNLTPPVVWQAISTNTADANGFWQFTDTNVVKHGAGFYRSKF
ncbi:MAG: LamG-like jellyroll fold domain-containing protein, partial [Verrucomicrobiota bacterium]